MKRLSVIIPGYNTRQEWWVRCVQSVALAAAKVGEYEIVCIDDGSKVPVEASWFDGIDGVCVIREENKGLPTARNLGIERSTGNFLTFIDSDDEVLPDVYVKTLERMEETCADVGVFGINPIYLQDRYQVFDMPDDKYYGALTPADVAGLVKRRLFYYSCNKVFRRSFFEEHHLRFNPDGVPCEDAIFNVSLVVNKAKWVTVACMGYKYYRYDGTICSNYKSSYVAGTRACTKAWRDYKTITEGAYKALGAYDETSDDDIVRNEWTNIWRRNSPYTILMRYKYAKEHCDVLGRVTWFVYLKKAIQMWARAHLYVGPIRRHHQMKYLLNIGAEIKPIKEVK